MPEKHTRPYVIWVDFELDPAQAEAFDRMLVENASTSLEQEPGCRRFDILRPIPTRASVSLYEIYDSEEAFQAHLASAHYRSFAAASASASGPPPVRRARSLTASP